MPEASGSRQILVRGEQGARPAARPTPETAWKWVGRLGLTLCLAGGADLVLLWVPVRLGVPEWEFATVASTVSALPLVTIGLAGMAGTAGFLGRRWWLWAIGLTLLLASLAIALMLLLFLTNVPMAIRATSDAARLGILKAVAKTTVLAVIFGSAYLGGAFWALTMARGKEREV